MCVRVAVGGAVRLGIRFYGLGSGTAPFLSGLDLWQGMSAFGLDLYREVVSLLWICYKICLFLLWICYKVFVASCAIYCNTVAMGVLDKR